MDVSKLKVQELKDELEKRGIATTKSMKKKDLSDLLEEDIAKEGDATAAASTEEDAAVAPGAAQPETADATTPPPVTSASSAPSAIVKDPTSEQTAPPPEPAAFPPVGNEAETPLPKTDEQLAQTAKEEQVGAGEGGAEGAQQAGIAVSAVEPTSEAAPAAPEVEMDGAGAEEKAPESNKRPHEEDEAPVKRPRLATPTPNSTYPPNFIPSSHPPTRALYITNLRRPLPDTTFAEHLSSFGSLDTSASVGKESCGWWLSPVKSHAFVVYERLESAVTAYTSLQDCKTFPEEAGEGTVGLKVTFLPPTPIQNLIKQEQKAWTEEGRRKLELLVEKNEEGEWELSYKGVGDVSLRGAASMRGTGVAPGLIGNGYARGGAGFQQGFRGAPAVGGYALHQQQPRFQPSPRQPIPGGRPELGSAAGSAVSGGGTYTPASYTRAPAGPSSYNSAPRSSYNASSSSSSAPFSNGLDRSRPPHEPSSGASYPPRNGGPASYDRRPTAGGERATETNPRLSWGERGVYASSREGRGNYEREDRRRDDDDRRGGRYERDDRDDRDRGSSWGDRRR